MSIPGSPARQWLAAAVILVACFVVYAPALGGDFVWDDDTHLIDNPVLQEGGLARIWLSPPERINYWPVTWTSYWVEHRIWGFAPLGYHVVNVLIHAASAMLLWGVLLRLGVAYAWLAALVFALHPVNVESVAWIAQRKGLLSGFFFLLALLSYLRFEDRRGAGSYALALGSHLAAMLSKGAAAPLPAVLLLCAWWQRGNIARRDLWQAAPFLGVTAVLAAVEIWSQDVVAVSDVVRDDAFPARLAGAGWVLCFYLYKAILPVGLSFVYPRWAIDASSLVAWLPLLAFLGLLALAWWQRRSWGRPVWFALVYFALLLSPVLGFFDIYYMRFSYVADHYQYLALAGIVALLVSGAGTLLAERSPRALRVGVASIAVLLLAFATHGSSRRYRDLETLWRDTLAKSPDSVLAHYNLARTLQSESRIDEASHHYREVLRVEPDHGLAHNNLGLMLEYQGKPEQAMQQYQRALAADPGTVEAHNNLAVLLHDRGDLELAESHYRTALRRAPDRAQLHHNLAVLLEDLGGIDEAMLHYRRALQLAPQLQKSRAALARLQAAPAREEGGADPQ